MVEPAQFPGYIRAYVMEPAQDQDMISTTSNSAYKSHKACGKVEKQTAGQAPPRVRDLRPLFSEIMRRYFSVKYLRSGQGHLPDRASAEWWVFHMGARSGLTLFPSCKWCYWLVHLVRRHCRSLMHQEHFWDQFCSF